MQQSYEIGSYVFGIRTTSESFGNWLDETLGAYRSSEETDPYCAKACCRSSSRMLYDRLPT